MVYCTNCGNENPGHATTCANCGAMIQASPGRETPPPPPMRGAAYPGAGEAPGRLVPRDLGEMLSETFRVYKTGFSTFFIIALIAQIPGFIFTLTAGEFLGGDAGDLSELSPLWPILVVFVQGLITLPAQGAAIISVAHQYLGRAMSIGESYRKALYVLLSLISSYIVFFIIVGLCVFLSGFIIGIPLLFLVLVYWFAYVQAIVIENIRGPIQPLGRSSRLVQGSWWRVFGIGIVYVIVLAVLFIGAGIPGFIIGIFNETAAVIVLTISGSLVLPVAFIGAALVYFDLRIRKEGYTLERLEAEIGP